MRSHGACVSELRTPGRARRAGRALGCAGALLLSGCALLPGSRQAPPPPEEKIDASVYQHVATQRAEVLERENERLRADLRSAEETLLAVESGMRGTQHRAEAVSALAEARIEVDRAAARAPWRPSTAEEAREKIAEAERQLADEHFGSAIFFASRARRIASGLDAEADLVSRSPGARNVKPRRANLRSEPNTSAAVIAVLSSDLPVFVEDTAGEWALVRTISGEVGWVHGDLLSKR